MKQEIIAALLLMSVSVGMAFSETTLRDPEGVNQLTVHADQGKQVIAPEIYGHFAEHLGRCIYDGIWVGEDSAVPNIRGIRIDVLEALKKLNIPVLRWPGGCFADEYHWKDGIGPREKRPSMVNTHWGMVTETNAFGTHEFLDLCELLGCEAYIAGNVGSGTPEEMQDWIEYMTFDGKSEMADLRRANGREKPWRIKYFGVGNENWGCGGRMRPEYYADLYTQFATYVRSYSGNRLYRIACGPNNWDTKWMDIVLGGAARHMDAISLHYYVHTGTWRNKGDAVDFGEQQWFELMKMSVDCEELLRRQIAVMDKHDPQKRIGLYVDEWGTWWDPTPDSHPKFLYQQNTLRDAVSAGIFLNTFHHYCQRVQMANIAQTVNVLQAMVLTQGEKMIVTPTYHVFEMYKVHQGATLLPHDLTCSVYGREETKLPALSVSASKDAEGVIHITLCNLDPKVPSELECRIEGASVKKASGRVLTAESMNAHNTFENPTAITPTRFDGVVLKDNKISCTLPSKSVVWLQVR